MMLMLDDVDNDDKISSQVVSPHAHNLAKDDSYVVI
jgi:hypothetical protein